MYSYSKLSTIHDCPYNAYLTYIKPRDQCANVYSYLGTICHDTLEGIIEGKNTEADIGPAIENGLEELDMLGVKCFQKREMAAMEFATAGFRICAAWLVIMLAQEESMKLKNS